MNIFDYIDAGESGAQNRFSAALAAKIPEILQIQRLAKEVGLTLDQLAQLAISPVGELFDSSIINGLATALRIDLREVFRRDPNLSDQQCQALVNEAKDSGVYHHSGDVEDVISLFLLTRALDQKDKIDEDT